MAITFFAERKVSPYVCDKLAKLAPANPFATYAYFRAMHELGFEAWVIGQRDDQLLAGCGAFFKTGRLNRSLEITSLSEPADPDAFWRDLMRFCRESHITVLEVDSYASEHVSIPSLPGETGRRPRCEYFLDLRASDLWTGLSSNHRQNINRGRKAQLAVQQRTDRTACEQHMRLILESMDRRRNRGEEIAETVLLEHILALAGAHAGELFQAMLSGRVVSSVLVLRAARGAYYQSAGTSTEGMACGASHFLIYEIAKALQVESLTTFNLGGAAPDSGLQRFKMGFGSRPVPLERASFYLGGVFRKKLGTLLGLIRHDPRTLVRHLTGHVSRHMVYAIDVTHIAPPPQVEGLVFRQSHQELEDLPVKSDEFRREQRERFRRMGSNYAYGVFHQGKLAQS